MIIRDNFFNNSSKVLSSAPTWQSVRYRSLQLAKSAPGLGRELKTGEKAYSPPTPHRKVGRKLVSKLEPKYKLEAYPRISFIDVSVLNADANP